MSLEKEAISNFQNLRKENTKQWLVILNPHAGCGMGAEDKGKLISSLDSYKISYTLITSDFPRHAISLTVKFIELGYRKIIVCGGDGTLNEVVNGVFIQESTKVSNITIGVIPVGTGNDWVKTFGIPVNYNEAIKTILENKTVEQDIGKIVYNSNNEICTRFFANIAGFGFDAMVAEKANSLKEKGKKGFLVYIQSLVSSFYNYKTCKTKIAIDNTEIEDYVFTASIGIGRFNGGGMMQTPFAVPNSGKFQVTLVKKIGFFGILLNLRGLYSGEYVKDRRVSVFHGRKVTINGANTIQGEVDGENLGNSNFHIRMLDERLRVIYGDDKCLDKRELSVRKTITSTASKIPAQIIRR